MEKLEFLQCSDNKIDSLNGIENLINLTDLFIGNNLLTSLNGIEKLTKLENLSISNNLLTTLSSLKGIEKLFNLEYLEGSGIINDCYKSGILNIQNKIIQFEHRKKIISELIK